MSFSISTLVRRNMRFLMLIVALFLSNVACASATPPSVSEISSQLKLYDEVPSISGTLDVASAGKTVAFAAGALSFGAPTQVYLLDIGGSPTSIGEGSEPKFSPSGNYLAFWSSRSGERQLWLYDLRKKSPRMLSSIQGGFQPPSAGLENVFGGGLLAFAWAPDSSAIVAARVTERTAAQPPSSAWLKSVEDHPSKALVYPGEQDFPIMAVLQSAFSDKRRISESGDREVSKIVIFEIKTGRETLVPSHERNLISPRWIPGTPSAVVAAARTYTRKGPHVDVRTRLARISLSTGAAEFLTDHSGTDERISVSPDGRFVAFVHNESNGRGEPKRQRVLKFLDLRTRDMHDAQLDLPIRAITWVNADELAVVARDHLSSVLLRINAQTGVVVDRSVRDANVSSIAVDGQGETIYAESDPRAPLRIWRANDSNEEQIWTAPDPFATLVSAPVHLPLTWRAKDGAQVSAMLMLPDDRRVARPTVLNFYPAQARWGYEASALDGTQLLLSRGYAVLRINVRTPHTWFYYLGPEADNIGGKGVAGLAALEDDVDRGIDAAAATGRIDPARVCGFGHSNGGGALTQYVARSSRLRCAAIFAPASISWADGLFTTSNYPAELVGGESFWQNPDLYHALEQREQMQNVTTPTFFAVGLDDAAFALKSSNLYSALKFLGKSTGLVMYPGQGHAFHGEADIDYWNRKLLFFEHYLAPTCKDRAIGDSCYATGVATGRAQIGRGTRDGDGYDHDSSRGPGQP